MKLTLVGPVYPFRGGIAHYNASLAQALQDAGHTVQVVSFSMQYPAFLYPGKSDKDPSQEAIQFPARYILNPLLPWTWLYASRYILTCQPDMVVIHWWTTFWAPAYYCIARILHRKIPVTFLVHNVLPHEAKAWDRWLGRLTLRQGQAFIVQAPHERTRLLLLVPPASKIIEAHHPTYSPFSENFISKKEARQRLGLPPDIPILLFFGIVRPYKGLRFLVESLPQVTQPVHLVVAGEFWEDIAVYRKLVEDLSLADRVTIINSYIPNEEAHLLFSAADGLVAPYVGGTQSGAASLAVGYGLPVIMTDRVAAGMNLETAENGVASNLPVSGGYAQIVPPQDPLALARAIDKLIENLSALSSVQPPTIDHWSSLVKAIEQLFPERK